MKWIKATKKPIEIEALELTKEDVIEHLEKINERLLKTIENNNVWKGNN